MAELNRHGPARLALWAAVIACGVLLGMGPRDGARAIAQSGQEAAANMNQSVASNGSVPAAEAYSQFGDDEPFEGTGVAELDPEFTPLRESARDVWQLWNLPATTAPIGSESIIGADGRTRVSSTTAFPYRAVALITFSGGRCTGWLYGRNIVATAGHCVHSGGSAGRWRTSVRVYPGRNGSSSPYGYCSARVMYTVVGWASSRNEQYDYGAIKLNCNRGDTTGWFGRSTSIAVGTAVTTAGYPGDKPLTQWRATDAVRALTTRQVFYRNDTLGGQSGSPVWKAGNYGIAIHAYGLHGSAPHSTNNHGTRLASSVNSNLTAWKNAP